MSKRRMKSRKRAPSPPSPEEEDHPTTKNVVDDDDDDDVYDSADDERGASDALPGIEPASPSSSSDEGEDDDDDDDESYDSAADDDDGENDDDEEEVEDDGEGFEDQGSSDDEDNDVRSDDEAEDSDGDELELLDDEDAGGIVEAYDAAPRRWNLGGGKRALGGGSGGAAAKKKESSSSRNDEAGGGDDDNTEIRHDDPKVAQWMHADNLSSDDEDDDGTGNRIGRVPLHWYDEYDHIGYDVHGTKVMKSSGSAAGKDRIDLALEADDGREKNRFTVHDALNARDVTLTPRQIELIRRIQGGAYAHPEHDANPDYVDYYTGVDREISGINSNRHEPKHRFQPSKWDKLQVRRLLHRLKCGSITMEYLEGKVRDMNDVGKNKQKDSDKPFLLWKGDEEDELNLRKGPQHIAAPKQPPPGHAASYNPPEEYLPTEEEIKEWAEEDAKDRPHGLLIPQKFPNLRSVGAYEHAVRERFERCLDLYLCPRAMKRRLNIDPESLVPSLPKASDLRPFPTAKCVMYDTPCEDGEDAPMIRCLSVSPDGQFLASGAADGHVRLWEVQTGRLLRSWDVSSLVAGKKIEDDDEGKEKDSEEGGDGTATKPVVALEWNPNRSHHCLLAAVGNCAVVIATGTGGVDDAELTEALLSAAASCKNGGNIKSPKAAKAVRWIPLRDSKKAGKVPISAFGGDCGPVCALSTNREMASLKWHKKGDYFVTVSPKAGAAAVLIHQLSKASSQQPFSKAKGEAQTACFHPNKPFLFVASPQHIRIYHLVKQTMVKRLLSGCKFISSIDVHSSGDHVIAGSLDRRMVWFDLDLSSTPYKTMKYHERALRSVEFHQRYPLMASASDDGSVHVFHSMVYSDLMRNPLIVPVKILRGHSVTNKLGVLSFKWHPTQPWCFSAGADGKIHLYQDI